MRHRPAIVALLVALAAGGVACGGGSHRSTAAATATRAPSPSDVAVRGSLFGYDRLAPLGFRDAGVQNPGYPIAVHDVSYDSPRGGRVPGYLLVPPGGRRHPAVIFLHGSGGNRVELLGQATWMAARGAVALTIDSAAARAPAVSGGGFAALERERDIEAQTIVDLRRAVDLLQSRADVDPRRIAFVGWSAGAKSGAILSGVDHRIRSFALVSGGSLPVSAYTRLAPVADRPALGALLEQTDPLRYVRHSGPSALLLQDGLKDTVVPHRALAALVHAAGSPKQVRWYQAGHAPSNAEWRDQLRWLSARLGLHGGVVPGVSAGP